MLDGCRTGGLRYRDRWALNEAPDPDSRGSVPGPRKAMSAWLRLSDGGTTARLTHQLRVAYVWRSVTQILGSCNLFSDMVSLCVWIANPISQAAAL